MMSNLERTMGFALLYPSYGLTTQPSHPKQLRVPVCNGLCLVGWIVAQEAVDIGLH
jgi:hypothetical protein